MSCPNLTARSLGDFKMIVSPFLKKIENKIIGSQIGEIDFIYIINLDHCPDKLEECHSQLDLYNIRPQRVSGIYAKEFPPETFDHFGIQYDCLQASVKSSGFTFLNPFEYMGFTYAKTAFGIHTTKGQVGCALSHLSILKDAYESGYQTIWVLEDDFEVKRILTA